MLFYLCKINDKNIKVGDNLTFENDTVSLSEENVTNALGYTPASQDSIPTKTSDLDNDSFITSLELESENQIESLINKNNKPFYPVVSAKAVYIANIPKYTLDDLYNSIGLARGIAKLDENGKIPSSQLPSFDDKYLSINGGTVTGPTTFTDTVKIGDAVLSYDATNKCIDFNFLS